MLQLFNVIAQLIQHLIKIWYFVCDLNIKIQNSLPHEKGLTYKQCNVSIAWKSQQKDW